MTYSQFEVCKDTIPPSLTHIAIYFTLEKNEYQSSTNKQKIHAKQNNMQTLGKLTHVSDATLPQ